MCFLLWGAFISAVAGAALVSEGLVEVVAIPGAIVGGPIVLIGLFHALMVWRVRLIQLILGATIALPSLFFTDYFGEPWSSTIAAGYGLLFIAASGFGLRGIARSTAL